MHLELHDLLDYGRQVLQRGLPGGVWVRADIAEARRQRHLYLELVQREAGRDLARCRAVVWQRELAEVERKFRQGTGQSLRAGQSVLLFVTAEFHPLYGFSLHVQDIAPEFTRGEMETRLDRIRDALRASGLYDAARARALPRDLHRLLVIAPERAAGLGDFRREAERLSSRGVCEVVYLRARFQGTQTEESLSAAAARAAAQHAAQAADALIVLRGGGASADLEQLNSEGVARALLAVPLPLLTAIGHARDRTLLDEVATVAFDTPSKAAAWVLGTVGGAAAATRGDLGTIVRAAETLCAHERARTDRRLAGVRQAAAGAVGRERARTQEHMRAAVGLSPQRTLARGYALALHGGRVLNSARDAQGAGEFTLRFADGELPVRASGAVTGSD